MRRFAENYVFAFSADAIQRLAAALIVVWVSRRLGVDEAGIYFLGMSFAMLFGRISYWGLDQLLTREVARAPERSSQFMVNFIVVRALLSGLTMVALFAIVRWLGYAPDTTRVILLLGLTILPDSLVNICQSVFMAHERMTYLAASSLLNGMLRLTTSVIALVSGFGLEGIAIGFLVASTATLIALLYLIRTRLFRPAWGVNWRFCRAQLGAGFPFLLIGMFFILENQLDVVLLSRLRDEHQVGLYGAASTIVIALLLIPYAFQTAVFPVMSRLYTASPAMLERLYRQSLRYLFTAGLPIAISVTILAPHIITLAFSPAFAPSAQVLQILIWALFLIFLNIPSSRLLVAGDQQRIIAVFLLTSLTINITLNLLLIPRWGASGSATARVISTFVLFIMLARFVFRNFYRYNPVLLLLKPAMAGATMLGLLILLPGQSLLARFVFSILAYVTVLVAVRAFSRDDLRLLQQVMESREERRVC